MVRSWTFVVSASPIVFELNRLETYKGTLFTEEHLRNALPVCVIGKNVETKLFSGKDPVGQSIKCGNNYFTIIGVLDKRVATRETLTSLGLRDLNSDIFIPIDVSSFVLATAQSSVKNISADKDEAMEMMSLKSIRSTG